MATFVDCTIGLGVSDGEEINSLEARWSTLSSFDVVGGASPLLNVPGILNTIGDPLLTTQAATPAMKVTVKAGRVVVPANVSSLPPFALTLTANTDLDIATSHVTNPRIDLVIAKIYSPGTSAAAGTIEILTGTPAAVPTRPTLPSGDYHCISLATVTVPANATSIVNANIARSGSDTWTLATSDAGYTTAPGGVVHQTGLMAMSATRRQAWAARFAPSTPVWDRLGPTLGITSGTDVVPVTVRKLYEVQFAATQQANTTTPVTIANSGTLTVFGGTRRVRVTMSGQMGTDRDSSAGWNSGRVFLTGSGTITIPAGCRAHARVWGEAVNASVVSQVNFGQSWTFDVGEGTFSVLMQVLRVTGGGSGSGGNVIVTDACLLIEDIGPA